MSDSWIEEAFLHWWHLLAPDLPEPERELELIPNRKFRSDFVFREARVVIECDGGGHAKNGGRHAQDPDKAKINLLTEHGWRVFRYSGSMIERDPQAVIDQVARMVRNEVSHG